MLETDLFAFLERTADAAFVVTEQGEICSWNKSAQRLFGYPVSEVANRTCHELLDGRGALGTDVCTGGCSVQFCAVQHGMIPDFDLEVKTNSGSRLWVNISNPGRRSPCQSSWVVIRRRRRRSVRQHDRD